MRYLLLILISTQLGFADDLLDARKAARAFEQQEKYLEAFNVFVNAAEATMSDVARIGCLRTAAEIALARLDNATTALSLADRMGDPVETMRLRLFVYNHQQDYKRVVEEAKALDLSQWPPAARLDGAFYRGSAYAQLADWTAAVQDLQLAADTPGRVLTRVVACWRLGQVWEDQLQDVERAISAYRQGITLTRAAYAYRNHCFLRLTELLSERGKVAEALAMYDDIEIAKLPSDYWRVAFLSGHAHLHKLAGNLGSAATLYTSILRLGGATQGQKDQANAQIDAIITAMRE